MTIKHFFYVGGAIFAILLGLKIGQRVIVMVQASTTMPQTSTTAAPATATGGPMPVAA